MIEQKVILIKLKVILNQQKVILICKNDNFDWTKKDLDWTNVILIGKENNSDWAKMILIKQSDFVWAESDFECFGQY